MTAVLSTLLQAQPNAGFMQIVILVIVVLIIVVISKGGRKRELKNFNNLNIDLESGISNQKIRMAGYLLMTAGKNLFGSIFFTLILIPLNLSITMNISNLSSIGFLNIPFAILIIVLLFKGYNCIRRAGEILLT
jgi:hypothetical protein